MTKSTITREQLEEWVAQFDEDGGCDATDRQLEALIRQSLAAMDSEPVAEVVSIYGDLEDFGEREIRPLVGIQQMPYGTKLYRHAQPVPELKPVGYLFVSDQGAIAYSPTNWGMPGFRLAGQIYGDIDAFRAAMLQAEPVTTANKLGNSPVIPDGWQVEAEKLAEMYGMSFVLFRHGEAPQCADPTKVVISFTDKGLGHDTLPAAPQELK